MMPRLAERHLTSQAAYPASKSEPTGYGNPTSFYHLESRTADDLEGSVVHECSNGQPTDQKADVLRENGGDAKHDRQPSPGAQQVGPGGGAAQDRALAAGAKGPRTVLIA